MASTPNTLHGYNLQTLGGEALPLQMFAGKPLLIVNTASKCGMTPQYAGLQALWREFQGHGLVVLGVPSNDFGNQEPGDAAAIKVFCENTYGIDFPMAAKVHVRGPAADPLFKWLAAEGGYFSKPRWNFYKYLIGRDGRLKDWFGAITRPDAARFRRAVTNLLLA